MVAEQFPNDREMLENSGYFLPPQTLLIYAPFAAMPYPAAKVAWGVLLVVCAAAVLLMLRSFGTRWPSSATEQWLPVVILLNYLTLAIVELGQTSFLFVGCVAAGQWCFEGSRSHVGRSRLRSNLWEAAGVLLWAIPFIKPHVAISLLPLAWYLGGWRRAAAILAVVAGLNVAGCLMIGRSPLFLVEYVQYLGANHKRVVFNRVEVSPTITSWNRLVFSLGGPLVELGAVGTLASYLVWFGLAAGRVSLTRDLPSPAWAAAVAGVGGVFCAQVLVYELLVLVLVIPWLRMLFEHGYRVHGWLAVAALCLELIPVRTMSQFGVTFHPALGVALLAGLVLTGPMFADRQKQID